MTATPPLAQRITPIPAFADNYIWLLLNPDGDQALVVDPGDAAPVIAHCQHHGITLSDILITHHHGDHIGGVAKLCASYADITVWGPHDASIEPVSHRVGEGDKVSLPDYGLEFAVWDVPGHTAVHTAYLGHGVIFCGDTLFACGCGRVFGGSLQALSASLQRFEQLPADTLAYCAHEYTLDNIGFAKWVEPDNAALLKREADTHALIDNDTPSVPSTIGLERDTNPFLRVMQPAVKTAAEQWAGRPLTTRAEIFAALRTWKDSEYD